MADLNRRFLMYATAAGAVMASASTAVAQTAAMTADAAAALPTATRRPGETNPCGAPARPRGLPQA